MGGPPGSERDRAADRRVAVCSLGLACWATRQSDLRDSRREGWRM